MSPVAAPDPRRRRRTAGFTLIEVLVALAVVAASLGAIAMVAGSSIRGTRALERRVALLQTARAVETGIPGRDLLQPGRTEGEIAGHRWQMDVQPLKIAGLPETGPWTPLDVRIRVRGPGGEMVALETVRIVRSQPQ